MKEIDIKLLDAARSGNTEIVQELIAAGADINARYLIRNTPLHLAACNGHTDTVRALIKAGADVNSRNLKEETPLHTAVDGGDTSIIQELIKAGAKVNAQDMFGRTPLHTAVYRGLHTAVDGGDTSIIEALIKAGSDLNAIDKEGKTALDYAKTNNELYNQFIAVLAKLINGTSKEQAFLKCADKEQSWVNIISGEKALKDTIVEEEAPTRITLDDIEKGHQTEVKKIIEELQKKQNTKEKTKAQSEKAGVNINATQVAAKKSATQTQDSVMNVLSVASGLVEDIFIVFDGVFPTPSNHTKPNANDTLVTRVCPKSSFLV